MTKFHSFYYAYELSRRKHKSIKTLFTIQWIVR